MLNADRNHLQQRHAAWAIGTGIKNSYDFQLWLLESDYTHPSKLVLKTNNKKDKDYEYNLRNDVNDVGVNNINEKENTDTENKENGDIMNGSKKSNSNHHNSNALSVSVRNVNKTSVLNGRVEGEKNIKIDEADGKKSNDDRLDLNQHMTGLEKLVSLLHYSCIINHNINNSVESRGNMDELQRKVLYAISSAARGNIDIQNALLNIKKKNLYDIDSYEKQNNYPFNENSDDFNGRNGWNTDNENSIFLNYLIDMANNEISKKDNDYSNITLGEVPSYDIIRKVWGFIADMLQERAYIRGDLMQLSDLPENAMNEILSLKLLGDVFLTENWFDLASKNFEIIYKSNIKDFERLDIISEIEIKNNGEIEIGDFEREKMIILASEKSRKRNVKATLENVIVALQEIMIQNNEIKTKINSDNKDSMNSLIVLLTEITTSNEFKNEHKNEEDDSDYNQGFPEKAKKLLFVIQQ